MLTHGIEILSKELNVRKTKWLISCCHNPHINPVNYNVEELAIRGHS